MFEKYLVELCSPTLASLKTASLFNFSFSSDLELEQQLNCWNYKLNQKGIFIVVLQKKEHRALVYVFRKSKLKQDLNKPGVRCFLKSCGYMETDLDSAIQQLQGRFCEMDEFPHEIGLFLGYPLWDVVGFIENEGKNCKCVGCWKVYCNECEAKQIFAKFKKCRDVYWRLYNNGRSILQLTVAA